MNKESDYLFLECRKCGKVENIKYVDMKRQRIRKTPGNRRWSHRQGELSGGSQQCVILTAYERVGANLHSIGIFSIIRLMIIRFITTYHLYLRLAESAYLSIRVHSY